MVAFQIYKTGTNISIIFFSSFCTKYYFWFEKYFLDTLSRNSFSLICGKVCTYFGTYTVMNGFGLDTQFEVACVYGFDSHHHQSPEMNSSMTARHAIFKDFFCSISQQSSFWKYI